LEFVGRELQRLVADTKRLDERGDAAQERELLPRLAGVRHRALADGDGSIATA
jgi:ribosomal 50S subunit-associated protein YjgA (DUF615 family)